MRLQELCRYGWSGDIALPGDDDVRVLAQLAQDQVLGPGPIWTARADALERTAKVISAVR